MIWTASSGGRRRSFCSRSRSSRTSSRVGLSEDEGEAFDGRRDASDEAAFVAVCAAV
jgi:hypothetical protein